MTEIRRPSSPRIVEWYRADPWPRMRRALLVGPAVLTLGGVVVAASFLTHQPLNVRIGAAVLGLALVLSGALFSVVGMQRILRDEVSLALRTDGVALRVAGGETLVLWDSLAQVRWDEARRELVMERLELGPLVVAQVFAGIAGPELALRLLQTKRKVAMNLLR
jgi:hypothetical protein